MISVTSKVLTLPLSFMKGVAYQSDGSNQTDTQSYSDPLADEEGCKRDVKYLQELDTNVIRVYAIDPTKSHDACMKTFSDAGDNPIISFTYL